MQKTIGVEFADGDPTPAVLTGGQKSTEKLFLNYAKQNNFNSYLGRQKKLSLFVLSSNVLSNKKYLEFGSTLTCSCPFVR
jgi:hypothetical protein